MNDATSCLEVPNEFPDCIRTKVNQMRNVQEAVLTIFENQVNQAEFVSRDLVKIEVAIYSLSSITKQQDEHVKKIATERKVENVIYN